MQLKLSGVTTPRPLGRTQPYVVCTALTVPAPEETLAVPVAIHPLINGELKTPASVTAAAPGQEVVGYVSVYDSDKGAVVAGERIGQIRHRLRNLQIERALRGGVEQGAGAIRQGLSEANQEIGAELARGQDDRVLLLPVAVTAPRSQEELAEAALPKGFTWELEEGEELPETVKEEEDEPDGQEGDGSDEAGAGEEADAEEETDAEEADAEEETDAEEADTVNRWADVTEGAAVYVRPEGTDAWLEGVVTAVEEDGGALVDVGAAEPVRARVLAELRLR